MQTALSKPDPNSFRRKAAWTVLLLLALAIAAMTAIPVWKIQPFKPQTSEGLALSYFLRRWLPGVTLVALVVALPLVIFLWRSARRWWVKAALIFPLIPMMAGAWFARQNHFEWMFNPLPGPAYVRPGDVDFVSDDEMVLAVELNGDAVAYPVRQIAYHHVVQDTVGGVPVVATY